MKPQTKCEMCQAEQSDTNWMVFLLGLHIGIILSGLVAVLVLYIL